MSFFKNTICRITHFQLKQVFPATETRYLDIRGGETKDRSEKKAKKSSRSHKNSKEASLKQVQQEKKEKTPNEIFEYNEEEEESLEAVTTGVRRQIPLTDFIRRILQRTPPMTSAYLGISIVLTLFSFLFNGNQWPEILSFDWNKILLKGQIWRLVTGFFFLGSLDIFYLLTLQFTWQNMSQLEKLYFKTPEEFFHILIIGCGMLITIYTALGLPMTMLGHNLGSFLVFIWAKLFEGMEANFMDLFLIKVELLPYFYLLQSWLLERQLPIADILGIMIGWFYMYLKMRNLIWIPDTIRQFFRNNAYLKQQYARFREDFEVE